MRQKVYTRIPGKCVLLTAVALLTWQGIAEAVEPSLSTIVPRGAQRGTEVDLVFRGNNLADAHGLMFHTPGFSVVELVAAEDRSATFKVKIEPECALGVHAIRVRTKSGFTNLALLSVGNLQELQEEEPNNLRDEAPTLPLGVTVGGVVPSEDVDFFAFELTEGQRLSVEIEALRLGDALFDPKVRLFSPDGHELIAEDDTPLVQQDAAFTYVAEKAGRYVVAVNEASYGGAGNYHYRLHVGEFPRPVSALPWSLQEGVETSVTWKGDPAMSTQAVTVTGTQDGYAHVYPASDKGVSPTPMKFRVSPHAGVVEVEPNNGVDQATPGTVPGAFSGVIEEGDGYDWFTFEGKKGQAFHASVFARRLGSPLDPVLVVKKPDKANLDTSDDYQNNPDGYVRISLPEDGQYWVGVRDHLGAFGPTYAYTIEMKPIAPELRIAAQDNDTVKIAVPQGNRAFYEAAIRRTDFDGPVALEFPGLPAGLTPKLDTVPAGYGTWPVVIEAAADAPLAAAPVNVTGKHTDENSPVTGGFEQDIMLIEYRNDQSMYDWRLNGLAVAVTEPAPFSIEAVVPTVPVVRRGALDVAIKATRAEGFTAPIEVTLPWSSPGMAAPIATIPEGQNETTIRLSCRHDAATGTFKHVFLGKAAGYTVCTNLTPIEVVPPFVNFNISGAETEQGKPMTVPVTIGHATPFEGEINVWLRGMPDVIKAEPIVITKETTEAAFQLEVPADAPVGKIPSVFCQFSVPLNGQEVPHVSGGADLKVFKPLPPELAEAAKPEPKPEEKKPDEPERETRFPSS